jgi:hypothetical protein
MDFIGIASISAFFITGSTLLCLPQFIRRVGSRKLRQDSAESDSLYQDEDGTATRESMSKYIVNPQKIAILLATCCGLNISIAFGICVTRTAAEEQFGSRVGEIVMAWLFTANWVRKKRIKIGAILTFYRYVSLCEAFSYTLNEIAVEFLVTAEDWFRFWRYRFVHKQRSWS